MKDLTLHLKGQYFDEIKAGTKHFEYREMTAYWRQRLQDRTYDRVILLKGYPAAGGIEGETRLTRKWKGYVINSITHPHFGPDPVTVFAINVEEIVYAN